MSETKSRRAVSAEELAEVVRKHGLWREGVAGGEQADLRDRDLDGASLNRARLNRANLNHASLVGANLNDAILNGAVGLLDPVEWLKANFRADELGIIVYKRIGAGKTEFASPERWVIEPDQFLTEVVNPERTTDCGSGVNFGTEKWCRENYTEATLWRCRIRWMDLASVVVPYGTTGKARCGRLELLEIVEEK
jgi:hypothetical protein